MWEEMEDAREHYERYLGDVKYFTKYLVYLRDSKEEI